MTVKELKRKLLTVHDDAEVVFQANEPGVEDTGDEATHTYAFGTVFEAWERESGVIVSGREFVIDGFTTSREW